MKVLGYSGVFKILSLASVVLGGNEFMPSYLPGPPSPGSLPVTCPPGTSPITVNICTVIYVKPIYVSTYCEANTIITIDEDITINVSNAPTTLVTDITATVTTVSHASVSASLPSSSSPPLANLIDFLLAIQPIAPVGRRQVNPTGFLGYDGSAETSCSNAALFEIQSNMLFDSEGRDFSVNPGTTSMLMVGNFTEDQINVSFSVSTGILTWNNEDFTGGSAIFCQNPDNTVLAVFNGMLPGSCAPVNLLVQSPSTCSNLAITSNMAPGTIIIETPTGGSPFTGPYTTETVGIGGSIATTLTLPPTSGGSTGTIIVESPTGGVPFTGPYDTTTTGIGGSVTSTVTIQPTGPYNVLRNAAGTVIIETPTGGSPFTGPYTTETVGIGGSIATTLTLPPIPGQTIGTVIVESPTGGSPFTGPYDTTTTGIGGSVTSTITIQPTGPYATTSAIFTGPLTTTTESGSGSTPTTVTIPPTSSGGTGIVVVQQPTTSSVIESSVSSSTVEVSGVGSTSTDIMVSSTTEAVASSTTGETLTTLTSSSVGESSSVVPTSSSTSSTTSTTVASTTTTSGLACSTVTATASPACATILPSACESLSASDGLALIPLVPLCVLALGPYAIGDAATCLATSAIGLGTTGTSILSCLSSALSSQCISTLPPACTNLGADTGLAILTDLPTCVAALGPFALSAATTCLTTGAIDAATSGGSIVSCLTGALGLTPPTISITCLTETGGVCVQSLPSACSDLSLTDGILLIGEIPACTLALAGAAVGAATCLVTSVIDAATTGASIVDCLNTSILCTPPIAV